jgi:ribosomal protein L23
VNTVDFDTFNFTRQLESAGFTRDQAASVAQAMADLNTEGLSALATKGDLEKLTLVTKADIQALRSEIKTELQDIFGVKSKRLNFG